MHLPLLIFPQKKKKKFLLFFVELDIPKSFKSNLFLIRRKIAKKFFFEKLKCQMQKLADFFFQKKKLVSNDSELSNSARNDIKKISAADGGFRRQLRDRRRFFSFPCRHIQF